MIYIVRHGETDWNLEGRYQGSIDIELNDTGIKQALEIRDKLKDIEFDKVFSSPLKRAYKTAEIIWDKEIIKDNRLMERNNGELEGRLKSEIFDLIDFNDPNESRYGIESITSFRNRIYEFLDEICEKYKGKNILIVTHGGIAIYTRCYFEGEPKNNDYGLYKVKNCEVLKLDND